VLLALQWITANAFDVFLGTVFTIIVVLTLYWIFQELKEDKE